MTQTSSPFSYHHDDGEGVAAVTPRTVEYPALAESTLDKSTIWQPSLPGQKTPQEGCGSPVPYHCNMHGESFWLKSHCLNRGCPDCYELWASKEASRASKRVAWGFKSLKLAYYRNLTIEGRQYRKPRLNAFIVSLRLDGRPLTRKRVAELRRRAYAVCQSHGIVGGCAVIHPFRKDRYDHWTSDDTIHFHIVGMTLSGWTAQSELRDPGLMEAEKTGEIVFKALPDREMSRGHHRAGRREWWDEPDWIGFRAARAVRRELQYLLTHAGIAEGEHALTWFGAFSYNRLTNGQGKLAGAVSVSADFPGVLADEKKSAPCPVCGSRDTEPCIEYWHVPVHFYRSSDAIAAHAWDGVVHQEPDHPPDEIGVHEAIWLWLKSALTKGAKSTLDKGWLRMEFLENQPEWPVISKVVAWNIASGRLELTPDGQCLKRRFEPTLDSALCTLRKVILAREPADGRDIRLESLIASQERLREDWGNISDEEFIFGTLRERYERQLADLEGID